MAKFWDEQADLARTCLEKARRRMKRWADESRRPKDYSVGDQVFVKLIPQQYKVYRSMHKGLLRRYEGPFPIIKKVGNAAYKVDLPPTLRIHPVFHVSMLKPYHGDKEDPTRGISHRAPPINTKSFDKEVEEVLTKRVQRRHGVPPKTQYLIKWKGLPESEASWEFTDDLWQFQDEIRQYEASRAPPQ